MQPVDQWNVANDDEAQQLYREIQALAKELECDTIHVSKLTDGPYTAEILRGVLASLLRIKSGE